MITLSVDDHPSARSAMRFMLGNIDPEGTHMTARNMEEAFEMLNDDVQIVFLDIEMPDMNGMDAIRIIKEKYDKLNVIFVTGHPEYSLEAHSVHPSGFLTKPVTEADILRELKELRFPLESKKKDLVIKCSPFAVFVGNEPFDFKRDRTMELFAFLVYKNGAFCTIGEALGILWDGDPDKKGHLRQLVLDMRKCLSEIDAEEVLVKKYGKICINTSLIQYDSDPTRIIEEFCWY